MQQLAQTTRALIKKHGIDKTISIVSGAIQPKNHHKKLFSFIVKTASATYHQPQTQVLKKGTYGYAQSPKKQCIISIVIMLKKYTTLTNKEIADTWGYKDNWVPMVLARGYYKQNRNSHALKNFEQNLTIIDEQISNYKKNLI